MRVATDIGGTFTDLVYYDFDEKTGKAGAVRTRKADTTPPHFEEGVLDSFRKAGIAPEAFTFFAHGTTVVINALLATGEDKPEPPENPMSADRVRWEHIQRVYELCDRNVSETARRLNMHRRTLQRILAKRAPR